MRILFTTQPAFGHFHPLRRLARAAEDAGHRVAFATSGLFAPTVLEAGFRVIPAGLDWLEADKSTVPHHLKPAPQSTLETYFAQQFVGATALPMAEDLARLPARDRPDVIVRERTEFGGAIAGDVLGVPVAAVQVGSPGLITPAVLAAVAGPYNAARIALGLKPDDRLEKLEDQVVFSEAPPALLDHSVPAPRRLVSLAPPARRPEPSAGLPDWARPLGRDRPLVYATLGTVFNAPAFELPFFPIVLDALRDEPLDLVVTVGPNVDPASLGPQPPNVFVRRYVAQDDLFLKCSAIVCHGGYGTILGAIEAGVPTVVVPFGADQPLNAQDVQRLGIGRAIEEDDLTPDRVRAAVRSLLDDGSWRRRVEAVLADWSSLPSIDRAVRMLERLAAEASVSA